MKQKTKEEIRQIVREELSFLKTPASINKRKEIKRVEKTYIQEVLDHIEGLYQSVVASTDNEKIKSITFDEDGCVDTIEMIDESKKKYTYGLLDVVDKIKEFHVLDLVELFNSVSSGDEDKCITLSELSLIQGTDSILKIQWLIDEGLITLNGEEPTKVDPVEVEDMKYSHDFIKVVDKLNNRFPKNESELDCLIRGCSVFFGKSTPAFLSLYERNIIIQEARKFGYKKFTEYRLLTDHNLIHFNENDKDVSK